jgi:two-component system OmpR family sensor kinase
VGFFIVAKRVFEPFRKSSANGYKAGAGLGLSVIDALVRAHGGTVAVLAAPDRVAFSFTIPLWKEG